MHAQALESKSASSSVRVFLSFATNDAPLVDAFRDRITRQHPNIELLDHAVKDTYEEDWKRECARKIDQSEMLMCLVGPTTHRSQAVAWEIDHGMSLGKRIVAIHLGIAGVKVPEVLARYAIEPQRSLASIGFSSTAAPALEREANGPFG